MTFNEWLYRNSGVTSDDMTDEDYDNYWEQWEAQEEKEENT